MISLKLTDGYGDRFFDWSQLPDTLFIAADTPDNVVCKFEYPSHEAMVAAAAGWGFTRDQVEKQMEAGYWSRNTI